MMLEALVVGFFISTSQICPTPPVITLNGDTPVWVRCNQPYVELGATAWSACDGDLSQRINVDSSQVDTSKPGVYEVTYTVSDYSAPPRTTVKIRQVIIEDYFSLKLNGYSLIEEHPVHGRVYVTLWECAVPYDDPGAEAWDDCDGNLTPRIVVTGADNVLPSEINEGFLVNYRVENNRGDVLTKNRLVVVTDTQEPVIALHGDGESVINFLNPDQPQPEWWFSARMAYEERYENELEAGDMYPLPMSWFVRQEFASVRGSLLWHCDKPHYEDPGASAYDQCEGVLDPDDIIMIITRFWSNTNTETFQYVARMGDTDIYPTPRFSRLSNSPGHRIYYLIYDSSGNPRQTGYPGSGWRTLRSRIVEPIYGIGFEGISGETEVQCHDPFDPREDVIAYDLCEGDISSRITISGSVNTSVPGSYRLRYDVMNIYGTRSWAFRDVIVVDNEAPVIVLQTETGAPATVPITFIPWCSLRDNGVGWWEGDDGWFALRPGRGWTVRDRCDDDNVLTNRVSVLGRQELRDSLEFLAAIRNQGVQNPIDPTPYLREYTLRHNVTDNSGNRAIPAWRLVNVVPTYPRIVLEGEEVMTIECGDPFEELPVELLDEPAIPDVAGCRTDLDEDFLTVTGTVNPDVPGEYIINYYAVNALGFEDYAQRIVRVVDTSPPVVTIEAQPGYVITPHLEWESGRPFIPADVITVSAYDSCDGEVAARLTDRGGMDFSAPRPGSYRIVYSAVDNAGNTGTATLRVIIETEIEGEVEGEEDDREPTIELLGEAEITIECGDEFVDPGAAAEDEVDGDLDEYIVVIGKVEAWEAGTYMLVYEVVNSVGNSASVNRTVIVEDTQAPVITLRGATNMTITLNDAFVDPGYSAEDVCDGTVTVSVTGEVDTGTVGTYTLTYTATDSAGNEADPLTRHVRVTEAKEDDEEGEIEGEVEGEIEGETEPEPPPVGCRGDGGLAALIGVIGGFIIGLLRLLFGGSCTGCHDHDDDGIFGPHTPPPLFTIKPDDKSL